jgi:hypothetical protein
MKYQLSEKFDRRHRNFGEAGCRSLINFSKVSNLFIFDVTAWGVYV